VPLSSKRGERVYLWEEGETNWGSERPATCSRHFLRFVVPRKPLGKKGWWRFDYDEKLDKSDNGHLVSGRWVLTGGLWKNNKEFRLSGQCCW